MSETRNQNPGRHTWFVVAMALAAAAGYGWGLLRQSGPTGEGQGVVSSRGHRERKPVTRVLNLTAQKFVRESLKGAVDERLQWRRVRCFSEDEVKAAIAELGNFDRSFTPSTNMPEMLFYRWGELDPVAANEAAKAAFPKRFSAPRRAVIAAWIKQGGGVEACNAVRGEGQAWDCTRTVKREVADMIVASLSDRDDTTAFKEVLRLNEESCTVADRLCFVRARKAAKSHESRAAFLTAAALHREPRVLQYARDALFRVWEETDPEAARAWMESLPPIDEL